MARVDPFGYIWAIPIIILFIGMIVSLIVLKLGGKKAGAVSMVIVLVVMGILAGYQANRYDNPPIFGNYYLTITTNSSDPYVIIAPEVRDLESSLKINGGKGKLGFIWADTPDNKSGRAVKISGQGNITLSASRDDFLHGSLTLTLLKSASNNTRYSQYWFFCNRTNPASNLTVHLRSLKSFQGYYETSGFILLTDGWNGIPVAYSPPPEY